LRISASVNKVLPVEAAGVDFVVLVATSLTFETTGFFIVSVNPALALLLLMKLPDVSLELGIEAPLRGRFNSVAPLPAFGTTAALAVPVFLALVFVVAPAADFTLFFAGVFADLAAAFVVAGVFADTVLDVPTMAFFGLLATAFNIDLLAVLPTLLAAGFFVADLVTVAFIVSPVIETPDLVRPPENPSPAVLRQDGIASGAACDFRPRILPNDYLRCLKLNQNDNSLYQTLFQTANKSFFGEILADKNHFAAARFAFGPFGADVGSHCLMHALEHYLAIRALHP
jgi:hypothetical protein